MGIIEWIYLPIVIYLTASIIRAISGKTALPYAFHLSALTLLNTVIVPIISHFLDLIPYETLRFLRIYIYHTFFHWETLIFVLASWVMLVFMSNRFPRLRIFLKKHQILLKTAAYLLAMLFFYIKYTVEPMVNIGFCEIPDPAEYLKFSRVADSPSSDSPSSLQTFNEITTPSTFWSTCLIFMASLVFLLASCCLNYLFYTPIQIA